MNYVNIKGHLLSFQIKITYTNCKTKSHVQFYCADVIKLQKKLTWCDTILYIYTCLLVEKCDLNDRKRRDMVVQDERGHARSMLGPAQHNVEETMVINTNDNAEDIVEDYAQPHRKAPIHNEKP